MRHQSTNSAKPMVKSLIMIDYLSWMSATNLFLFLLSTTLLRGCDGGPNEERLLGDIFSDIKHRQYLRPVQEDEDLLQVTLGLTLRKIIDIDVQNEKLITNMWLNYEWSDYKLSWDADDYGGVDTLRLPSKLIFLPDILLQNSVDEVIDSKYATTVVVVSNGTCRWHPPGVFTSSCPLDVTFFPFDRHSCSLTFGSWSYDSTTVQLSAAGENRSVDTSTYEQNNEWELTGSSVRREEVRRECCPTERYIRLTFILDIKRRPLFYVFIIIIPCALISLLALFTFLLPAASGEKITLGITILLALVLFHMMVANEVTYTPARLPIIVIYLCMITAMCTLSLILAILILRIHHRPDTVRMPACVRFVMCECLARCLCVSPGVSYEPHTSRHVTVDQNNTSNTASRPRRRHVEPNPYYPTTPTSNHPLLTLTTSLTPSVENSPAKLHPSQANNVSAPRPLPLGPRNPSLSVGGMRGYPTRFSPISDIDPSLHYIADADGSLRQAAAMSESSSGNVALLRLELAAIVAELRAISEYMAGFVRNVYSAGEGEGEEEEVDGGHVVVTRIRHDRGEGGGGWERGAKEEWILAASVVDRIFFILCTVVFVIVGVVVFFQLVEDSVTSRSAVTTNGNVTSLFNELTTLKP